MERLSRGNKNGVDGFRTLSAAPCVLAVPAASVSWAQNDNRQRNMTKFPDRHLTEVYTRTVHDNQTKNQTQRNQPELPEATLHCQKGSNYQMTN